MTEAPILLHTASGAHALRIALADGFWTRLRGLMLAPPLAPDAGLLLTRCASVHCAFMRQTIDVVYLDAEGTVLKCVPHLMPWRASAGRGARHTLELAAGAIARLGIRVGDRLAHPLFARRATPAPQVRPHSQSGLATVEFIVVGPLLILIGLGILQYGMLFFAKSQINHASFMAARAGSMGHASLATVTDEYAKALVPLYGGVDNAAGMLAAKEKVKAIVTRESRIQILNPTAESYQDWNDPRLQALYDSGGNRVIPNAAQSARSQSIGANSGQSIYDANLLKLRILHGYEPRIPIMKSVFMAYLRASDPGNDAFYTELVRNDRIPVVVNVTLHMQSDAIEGSTVSSPGAGNGGTPTNPGNPPVSGNPPPTCTGVGCNSPGPGPGPGPGPTDPNTPCTGTDCPVCPVG